MNNEDVLSKVDEIISYIENSTTYKKYLSLKKIISTDKEIMTLINEIKILQKDVVHHVKEKKDLVKKQEELNNHPLYIEYQNTIMDLNNLYTIIENRINSYFKEKLN